MIALLLAAFAQDYSFPTSDADHGHFYPTAYKDHGNLTDWACGGITYSGHRGSDFGVGGFAGMDDGRDVVAAADGVVTYTHDGEFDRCTTGNCGGGGGFGNYVQITHPDGKVTYYAHLKMGSVAVSAGQQVQCGQHLGLVGSSGNSTGPHLHFEVRVGGVAHDPYDGPCSSPPTYWVAQGAHGDVPARTCNDPVCVADVALTCGGSVSTANNTGAFTQAMATYACTTFTYTGPERGFTLTPTVSEDVTLALSGLAADLDLFVLGPGDCVGGRCVAASTNGQANPESLTFAAVAGQTYHVVVDGYNGATSAFTLAADCTPPTCHAPLANGHADYCSDTCPCDAGDGDCDGGGHCAPGLVCVRDDGAAYGFDPITDVCALPAPCADDAAEPDDDAALAPVGPRQGRLCPLDEDWTAQPLRAGDVLTATLALDPADADLDLYLLDAAGVTLAASEGTGPTESITWTAPADGTVYLRVVMYDDQPGTPGGADWSLDTQVDAALQLDVSALVPGSSVSLEVRGAPPGSDLALGLSPGGPGPGPCPPTLGGLCLDLPRPRLLAIGQADAQGRWQIAAIAPRNLVGTFTFQAVVIDGPNSQATAPVSRSTP